jgi:hypothetical protein
MAPVDKIDHNVIEGMQLSPRSARGFTPYANIDVSKNESNTCLSAQIQDIVQDLYELMVQAAAYDNVGPGARSKDILQDTVFVPLPSSRTLRSLPLSPTTAPVSMPP